MIFLTRYGIRKYKEHKRKKSAAHGAADYDPGLDTSISIYWRADFSSLEAVAREWDYETGAGGWGNEELQTYTGSDGGNTTIRVASDGSNVLVITAKAHAGTYTSARLTSKQTFARPRGYVCAVLEVPCAKGIWPAFWAMPVNVNWPVDGEIDIMETWNGKGRNGTCLHWGQHSPEDKDKHRTLETHIANMNEVHEYGFCWTESRGGRCMWFIDGRPAMRANAPSSIRTWDEFQLKLNVAMGGNVTGKTPPAEGGYELIVHSVEMQDGPPGGWEQMEQSWDWVLEGNTK